LVWFFCGILGFFRRGFIVVLIFQPTGDFLDRLAREVLETFDRENYAQNFLQETYFLLVCDLAVCHLHDFVHNNIVEYNVQPFFILGQQALRVFHIVYYQ
jgi:hypothetical protein